MKYPNAVKLLKARVKEFKTYVENGNKELKRWENGELNRKNCNFTKGDTLKRLNAVGKEYRTLLVELESLLNEK